MEPIKLGLLAPLSGPTASSGQAIERGMILAIQEINEAGGVLERPLELVIRNIPNKRAAEDTRHLRSLLEEEKVMAVFGGTFDGVTHSNLELIHQQKVPFINIWGTVTQAVKNEYEPNYIFCISMTDGEASKFLARYGVNLVGIHKPSILADTSDWGEASTTELVRQLEALNVPPVHIERFDIGERNMTKQLEKLQAAGADSIFLIGGPEESTAVMRGRATLSWNTPILSQWGTGNRAFMEKTGIQNTGQLYVLQTFSFAGARSPQSEQLLKAYHEQFATSSPGEIDEPMGVAHGYDAVYLLVKAIEQGQTITGSIVKDALEHLQEPYNGVLKQHIRPFSPENHIALNENDYMMAIWQNGRLVPAPRPRLEN
ncbi:MAG: ABC transporter substrate-binding protein [Chloroflexota bacterium]